ncbi:uncharacterized protein [Rutidosis leptorrhynchoides]|uniref:uncharacterized protein isoform X2 n=1 Tax=Rutidosis leptorrhynchoides TaxID=125765 RepID=UPI003A99ADC1
MAVLNFTLLCHSKPHSSLPLFKSSPIIQFPISSQDQTKVKIKFTDDSSISFGESISKACITALISASIAFTVDPALAFKSILRQTNFKNAKLLGASFFDADLTGADLSDADLRGADFSLAQVTKANLTNANLEGALVTGNTSFKGSIITGADFTDVPLREDQKEYLCKIADGVNPTTGNETRETLFCK